MKRGASTWFAAALIASAVAGIGVTSFGGHTNAAEPATISNPVPGAFADSGPVHVEVSDQWRDGAWDPYQYVRGPDDYDTVGAYGSGTCPSGTTYATVEFVAGSWGGTAWWNEYADGASEAWRVGFYTDTSIEEFRFWDEQYNTNPASLEVKCYDVEGGNLVTSGKVAVGSPPPPSTTTTPPPPPPPSTTTPPPPTTTAPPPPPVVTVDPTPIPDVTVAGVFKGRVPIRLVDTRQRKGGRIQSDGSVVKVDVGPRPAALNLTAVQPTGPGHFITYPCADGPGDTSALNWAAGASAVPNMVLATPDGDGNVCIKTVLPTGGRTHVVLDRTGTVYPDGGFVGMAPKRLADTQIGAHQTLKLRGFESAAVLNLTAANPDANGHLTVYPCMEGRPNASAANYQAGVTKASMTIGRPDQGDQVCIHSHAATRLVVDQFGAIDRSNAFFPRLSRIYDSRDNSGIERLHVVDIPKGDKRPVVLNVTAVESTRNGHATVYPCGSDKPIASTVNFGAGQAVPNHVVIAANGRVCISTVGGPEIIVDHVGYLEPRS